MSRAFGELFECNDCHCLAVLHLHASGEHICKRGPHFSSCVRDVWVRVRLHTLLDTSIAMGDEVTPDTVGKKSIAHLALQSAGYVFYTPACRSSTHFSGIPTHVDDQRDSNFVFEATGVS